MYTVTKYPPGTFCWADNCSTDAEAARAFYVALFGWDAVEIPMGGDMSYTMFQLAGRDVAALYPMSPDAREAGQRSSWTSYVSVADIEGMARLVADHGGSVIFGPTDDDASGRMLHIQDASGARLGLWQPGKHIGAGIVNTIGAMSLNELWTSDVARAKDFYSALFGWRYERDGVFTRIYNDGRFNGGMLQLADAAPCWLPHFHVADAEDAIRRVKELGGAVEIDLQVDEDGSRWSVVVDPAGALFYIMQLTNPEPWE